MTRLDLMAMPAAPFAALGRWRPPQRLHAYWALFTASIVCFVLSRMLDDGALTTALAIGGVAGCGWSWLLTRALFQPVARDALWPRIVVGSLLVTGAISILTGDAPSAWAEPFIRVLDNVHRLTSSTVLLLTFVEPLTGYRDVAAKTEKRFRVVFAAGYIALLAVPILWLRRYEAGTPAAAQADAIKLVCAFCALLAGALAVRFRDSHPMPRAADAAKRRQNGATFVTADERGLADAILRVLRDEELYTTANLKVADLARRVGQPEHKVSACITGALGYANFNRLMNHFRIERAKLLLADPARADQQILSIALECGFASIGPFNRAFKEAVNVAPRDFRAAARRDAV